MLERVKTVEVSRTSAFGEWTGMEAKGLRISERRGLAMIELAAYGRGEPAREALSRAIGLALPTAGGSFEMNDVAALSVGPGCWLIIGTEAAVSDLPTPPEDAAAVTDLTGGRTILTLSGPNAVRTLMKGTAVDLDPAVFPAGAVAATALQRIPVVICRRGEGYDVIIPRSYAVSVLDWLVIAGRS
jgi:heterotetrameric sarcosine oxidase gamma subunit